MDDRKLQVFLAVIEHGSFSKASEHLNCTQSAVTQTINRLEQELNCRLLARHHSGVQLTAAGEELLPELKAAWESLDQLRSHASQMSDAAGSRLRIGAFSSIANTWLPQIMRSYREARPGISLDLKIGTGDLEDLLFRNKIDIALGDHIRLSRTDFIPLMKDRYYAAVPKSFKLKNSSLTQDDLSELPFLMAPMNALDQILAETPKQSVIVDCDDDITLLNMVAQGLGATVMPKLSLSLVPKDVEILPLEPELSRTIGIGLTAEASAEAKRFCSFVQSNSETFSSI